MSAGAQIDWDCCSYSPYFHNKLLEIWWWIIFLCTIVYDGGSIMIAGDICCSQTMTRFAQFFISPLLKEDSVDREIQAVESGMKSTTVLFFNSMCLWFVYSNHNSSRLGMFDDFWRIILRNSVTSNFPADILKKSNYYNKDIVFLPCRKYSHVNCH